MGNEIEERIGTFNGMKNEGKRVLIFMDEGEEDDRKYSAFEPLLNLADLKIGREYRYKVEHKPMGGANEGKFYHNLVRKGRDAEFIIEETGQAAAKKTPQPTPTMNRSMQAPAPTQREDSPAWKVREFAMRRGGYSHDAAAIVAAIMQRPEMKLGNITKDGPENSQKDAGEMLNGLANMTVYLTDQLVKAAEEREEKFKKQLELGSLKPQKQAPIETEV